LEAADAIKQSRQHQEKLQESSNSKKNAENADNRFIELKKFF